MFEKRTALPQDINYYGSFGNAPHQNLTWDQFYEKFKKGSQDSVFEELIPVIEQQPNKSIAREAIEDMLEKCSEQYPVDTFKKAYKMSQLILEDRFVEVCDHILISEFGRLSELERSSEFQRLSEFDNTHWNNNRDFLLSNPKKHTSRFPYTSFVLHLFLAFIIFQMENSRNAKITKVWTILRIKMFESRKAGILS